MATPNPVHPVLQLRIAITTSDYERLVKLYCEWTVGIEPAAIWNSDGGDALMLEMGKATLELFDERHAEVVDQLEVGRRVSGAIRSRSRYQMYTRQWSDCSPKARRSSIRLC